MPSFGVKCQIKREFNTIIILYLLPSPSNLYAIVDSILLISPFNFDSKQLSLIRSILLYSSFYFLNTSPFCFIYLFIFYRKERFIKLVVLLPKQHYQRKKLLFYGEIIVYSRSTIIMYSLLSHEWWVLLIKFMVGPTIHMREESMHLWYSKST